MKSTNLIITAVFLLFYTATSIAQCFDDGHSPFQNQGWLSCKTSVGPIQERGNTHWLLYDLGEKYTVDALYFWNHNVWGETGMGVKQILIDYSNDKINWKTAGPFNIAKAPGSWKYTGVEGPDLNHAVGQYFLITVINTWDNSTACAGLGEIKFILGESVDTEDEINSIREFTISPNPASNNIELTLPDFQSVSSLAIYNTIGQKVINLDLPLSSKIYVPISQLESGLYHVSIKSNVGMQSKSFIKIE